MAERRMFAKSIVLSDAFLDMPLSARCLYFTLGMLADDDGFVGSPKAIMRQCGASQDDMIALLQKKYVLEFESGVIVIKHWRMNNYLQNDRRKPTTYIEELSTLGLDKKGAYTRAKGSMYTECIQNVYTGKDSIGKYSINNNNNILSELQEKKSENDKSEEIIAYLNSVLGSRYTKKNKNLLSMINARISEGHTVDDFKCVIDKKYRQWHDNPKMVGYLRPETLFCAKHFDSYLNEKVVEEPAKPAKPQNKFAKGMITHGYDFSELEKMIGDQK